MTLPPGRAKLATKPAPTGSATKTNTIVWFGFLVAAAPRIDASGQDNVRRKNDQIRGVFASFHSAFRPANVDLCVATIGPAQSLQPT